MTDSAVEKRAKDLANSIQNSMNELRQLKNELRQLKKEHQSLRLGYQLSPGGILNAFRECDVDFLEATEHLEKWSDRRYYRLREMIVELAEKLDVA